MLERLGIVGTFPDVAMAQAKRARDKRAALRNLFPDARASFLVSDEITARDAALVDHLFYLALDLVKNGQEGQLDTLGNALTVVATGFDAADSPLSVCRDDCIYVDDSAFLSPIYLYDFARSVRPRPQERLSEAMSHISVTGLDAFVRHSMGLVVKLDEKSNEEHLESYTITALHGSIFMDVHATAIRNAETLVHESSHNWLNYLFDHFDEPLPDKPTWFSPWRGVERPVAGMVHAIVAFAFVILFLRTARERIVLPPAEAAYAEAQARAQMKRLAALEKDVPDILAHIRSRRLIDMIFRLCRAAI